MSMMRLKTLRELEMEAFESRLAEFPGLVGQRNTLLVGLCRRGLAAGLGDEELGARILAGSGSPPLTRHEIARAIAAAHASPTRPKLHINSEQIYTPQERAFVRSLIAAGRGTTLEGLQRSSGVAGLSPGEQAARQMRAIVGEERFDPLDFYWFGTAQNDSGRIWQAVDVIEGELGETTPVFFIPNAVSGARRPTKDGRGVTQRGDNCVDAPKLVLLEFDHLPIDDQLAVLGAVLRLGLLRVVSIVHSGGKSLHAIVEVEGEYAAFRAKLIRLFASSDDPRERIDRAVLHPAALTRLAGATRVEKDMPDTLQTLVWADAGGPPR